MALGRQGAVPSDRLRVQGHHNGLHAMAQRISYTLLWLPSRSVQCCSLIRHHHASASLLLPNCDRFKSDERLCLAFGHAQFNMCCSLSRICHTGQRFWMLVCPKI